MKSAVVSILFVILSFTIVNAQKVKFKDGVGFVDKQACLTYEGQYMNNVLIQTMDGKQTFYIKYLEDKFGKTFTRITFAEQKKSFDYRSFNWNKKYFVNKLIESGLLNSCDFDESKIDQFILRYDESIDD